MINFRLPLLLLPLLLVAGCGSKGGQSWSKLTGSKPRYGFRFLNRAGVEVKDLHLQWGTNAIEDMFCGANHDRGQLGYYYDVPQSATFGWSKLDGTRCEVRFDIPHIPAEDLNRGEFLFVILDDCKARNGFFNYEERFSPDFKDLKLARGDNPDYAVSINKRVPENLTPVAVFFGNYEVYGDPDQYSEWSINQGLPYKVTDDALVRWTDSTGVHEHKVSLQGVLPEDLNGVCIGFTIHENREVTVDIYDLNWWRTGAKSPGPPKFPR